MPEPAGLPEPTRLTSSPRLNPRFVRAFVAEGSGIDTSLVMPGNRNAPTPIITDGAWATVLLVSDQPQGQTFGRDENEGWRIWTVQYRVAIFSVQFFSQPDGGAVESAARFCLWCGSDDALIAAEGGIDAPLIDGEPAWVGRPEMRIELPLAYEQIDDIDDEQWEERALVNLRCHYFAQYRAKDYLLTEYDVTVDTDGGPVLVPEPPDVTE